MGKFTSEEIEAGQPERVSRWFVTYSLFCAIGIGLILCARPIIRYWPAITSTAWELYQCVAGLR